MIKRGIIALIVVVISVVACEPEPPKKLSKSEKYTVDTLFNKMKDSLYKEMDKVCEQSYDSLYKAAIDSIKTIRLKEIQSILGK